MSVVECEYVVYWVYHVSTSPIESIVDVSVNRYAPGLVSVCAIDFEYASRWVWIRQLLSVNTSDIWCEYVDYWVWIRGLLSENTSANELWHADFEYYTCYTCVLIEVEASRLKFECVWMCSCNHIYTHKHI